MNTAWPSLKLFSSIVVKFHPLNAGTSAARELVRRAGGSLGKTNPACEIKPVISMEPCPSMAKVTFTDGQVEELDISNRDIDEVFKDLGMRVRLRTRPSLETLEKEWVSVSSDN